MTVNVAFKFKYIEYSMKTSKFLQNNSISNEPIERISVFSHF